MWAFILGYYQRYRISIQSNHQYLYTFIYLISQVCAKSQTQKYFIRKYRLLSGGRNTENFQYLAKIFKSLYILVKSFLTVNCKTFMGMF